LQHFARELARYFRNLMVARISGADTRLLVAFRSSGRSSPPPRRASEKRTSAAEFSARSRINGARTSRGAALPGAIIRFAWHRKTAAR